MNIELKNITKSFYNPSGEINVFNDFNLKVESGEFVSILGPNGSGKSTIFNLIIGLDKIYYGEILIESINNQKVSIAYMMQKDLLLPWKTVYENIIIGLDIQNKITSSTKEVVVDYLKRFGILNLIRNYPSQLSGGERQKVALIRTLILDSEIILLDEPFSAIDYNTRLELQSQIINLSKEKNKTILLITHDIDEAITVSDRAVILSNKPNSSFEEVKIEFDIVNRNPVSVKQDYQFSFYFTAIWNNLSKYIIR